MLEQHGLDLGREQVLAAPDHHVLEASGDPAVAALVHRAEVAGVQPAVGVDRGAGRVGLVEVLVHDQVAARAELADLAGRHDLVGHGIDDLHLGRGERHADGLGLVLGGVVEARLGDDRRRLGLAVDDAEAHPEARLDRAYQLRRHARASRAHRHQRAQVAGRDARMLHHRDQHRRNAEEVGGALALDELEGAHRIEGREERVSRADLDRAQRR
jgi:hypothetical protein